MRGKYFIKYIHREKGKRRKRERKKGKREGKKERSERKQGKGGINTDRGANGKIKFILTGTYIFKPKSVALNNVNYPPG